MTTLEIPPVPPIPMGPEDDGTRTTDAPRSLRTWGTEDAASMVLAVVAGVAFAELMRIVLRQRSLVGLVILGYLASMAVFFVLERDRHDGETALDRVVTAVIWSIGALVSATLTWMIAYVVIKGWKFLKTSFFLQDLSKVGPLDPGGGAKHAIIGTFLQVGLASLLVAPIAILTAIYLNEIKGRLAPPVRFITDALSGLPSIVAGLVVFTVFVVHNGFSGTAAVFALVILMIPTVTRTSEEVLRTVPDNLREGALAMGAPRWRVIMQVVVPTALPGLVTAVLLGIARAIGETAPMLLTAFGADVTNWNVAKGPQSDLPLFVWKLIRVPNETQNLRAWTGLMVLIFLVLILFVAARLVTNIGYRRLGRGR